MAPQILQGKNCTLMSFNVLVEGIILLIVVEVLVVAVSAILGWFWGRIELDFVVVSTEFKEIFLLVLALLESEKKKIIWFLDVIFYVFWQVST